MHFHYRVTFTGYIRCFCATTSHNLVTLIFDLLTLRVFRVQCFSCPTHIPIIVILLPSVTDHISVIWKSHCACAVSRDLCIGGPPKPHVTIFWLRIAYWLYNFYAATMTIKGSLYLSIPMLKQLSVAKKSSQNQSPKWRFFGDLRVQI